MLKAISPVDGRYSTKVENLRNYFSEYALIKYRLLVEVEYFLALLPLKLKPLKTFPDDKETIMRSWYQEFTEKDAENIKDIEAKTNHDVKAVEYFIKEKLAQNGLGTFGEMIHFGLTSQDINNTAIPLSLKEGLETVYDPILLQVKEQLQGMARSWSDIPMLSHTHGQPASPSTLGKELFVFADRISMQFVTLQDEPHYAKFGGAVGNLNAHKVTFPDVDWVEFADDFLHRLGLKRIAFTTQIDHYDFLARILQHLKRINTILIDFCRDIWTYISMGYFSQKTVAGEVGSSTMPHKVNPIDFENAEGNLGIANAIFTFLIDKLPVSRLQRDLTDSTVLRNLGVPIGHSIIALHSLVKGLNKLQVNRSRIDQDLESNWAVVSEAYQSILRREGIDQPYELLKDFTRGKSYLTKENLQEFVTTLKVSEEVKTEMLAITPQNYLGYTELPD